MRPSDEINKLIKKMQLKASANLDERVHEKISNAPAKLNAQQSAKTPPTIWRITMKNNITKFAAAAVIIIAVFVISMPFSKSGVAWGALAEKIQGVQTVMFRITSDVKMQGIPQEQIPKTSGMNYYSSEYGVRSETYMNGELGFIMYLNPEKNVYVSVIPESKRFMKVIDRSLEELRQMAEKEDPRVMVRRMMSMDYIHLGRDTINGIEVEGIECLGTGIMGGMLEEGTARLWVEVGTDYPVRIEIEGTASGGQTEMNMVMDDFQWDVELDEALFVPDIPSDYKKQEMTVGTDEDTAINGLRVFAELTDGRYPESLVFMSLMKEASEKITKKYLEFPEKSDDSSSALTDMTAALTEKQGDISQEISDIIKASAFYTQLVGQGKDIAYYGDTVTADDTNKVLLRWKVSDRIYRVVFGDLSAGDFSAEELAELEK